MLLSLPKRLWSVVVVFVVLFLPTTRAQSPGPREYLNIPVYQTVAYIDYVGTSSETVAANLPLPNNETVSHVLAPTILVSFPIDHKYAGASLTWPSSTVEVAGSTGKVEASGFNDPAIAFHKNIFGLPAFRHSEIAEAVPQTFLSVHFTFNPPLGEYNPNSQVNTGANRWAFTPLVNLNIPLNKGVSWVEAYAWGRFYTNNNAFQGNNVLSQDPLGSAAFWYSHNLGKKAWAAAGVFYDNGGETYVNHISQHDYANAFRPSVGINSQVWKFRVGLRYENTASKPNAEPWNGLLLLRVSFPPLFNF
jgi:Putative MetA-pathway of phenol degradation